MRPDQAFVWGIDLKPALKAINDHFRQLPEEDRAKGISAFAHSPPDGNLVAVLWNRFMRKGCRHEEAVESPELKAELLKRLKEFTKEPTLGQGEVSAGENITITRSVRHKRGSWWLLPKDFQKGQPEDD
jgi:hypothetical protein